MNRSRTRSVARGGAEGGTLQPDLPADRLTRPGRPRRCRRRDEKVLQSPPVGPPGPGPSGAWRSAAGRRPPGGGGPSAGRAGGVCERPCAMVAGRARGQCGPRRREGPAGLGPQPGASCGRQSRRSGRVSPSLEPSPAAHARAGRPGAP